MSLDPTAKRFLYSIGIDTSEPALAAATAERDQFNAGATDLINLVHAQRHAFSPEQRVALSAPIGNAIAGIGPDRVVLAKYILALAERAADVQCMLDAALAASGALTAENERLRRGR